MSKLKIIFKTNLFVIINLFLIKPFVLRSRIKLFGSYNPKYYPKNIKPNNIVQIESSFINKELLGNFIKEKSLYYNSNNNQFFNRSKLYIYWNNNYGQKPVDSEIINASHRFFWILFEYNKNINYYFNEIKDWIKLFQNKKDNLAWHPYNTSERICNWLVFLGCCLQKKRDSELVSSINKQINFLIYNLEYPASKIVNNHILNNARALYFSGSVLNRIDVKELGKELFYNHIKTLISNKGFLHECSVHYQLLINKWLIEIFILAQLTKDQKFIKFLLPIINSINKASSFFIISNKIEINNFPRIGDISPDMPFDYFNPFAKNKNKSHSNWNIKPINYKFKKRNSYIDGWLKQYFGDWTLFSYTHPNLDQYPHGHGHNDFSSICLYYKSIPIIIDIGAKSYDVTNADFDNGRSANDHSSLLINEKSVIEPGIGYKSIWSSLIRKKAKFQISKNNLIWSGSTLDNIKWTRHIKNKDNVGIRITDTILNNRNHILKSSFYLSNHIQFKYSEDNVFVFKCVENFIHFKFSKISKVNISETFKYDNYGVQSKIQKLTYMNINFDKQSSLDITIKAN